MQRPNHLYTHNLLRFFVFVQEATLRSFDNHFMRAMVYRLQTQLPRSETDDAERGGDLAHTTILIWVQRCVPEFEKKWNRLSHPVGNLCRVDETYIRVRGEWNYLYRAVDKQGLTVDFLLSKCRDIETAKRFFTRAFNRYGAPEEIRVDGYATTHTAVHELKEAIILLANICVRTSKYLNNLIEQNHRRVKRGIYPMLGFKRFKNTAIRISGIELISKMRKGQFDISELKLKESGAEKIWQAVLAA